ncbi:uncharacterized protein BDV14DRAFT_199898 [Aspergillus stella-maris]|uniref:uncharacterized protein n=1 Tax=Aspergillus stella-maris TaxID=1810926 RepID=UPI003CCE3EAC
MSTQPPSPLINPIHTLAYTNIKHIHTREHTINSLSDAQKLGIKLVALETPISSGSTKPLPFKPCFFLPVRLSRRYKLKDSLLRRTELKQRSKRESKRKGERLDTDKSTGAAGDPANARSLTPSSSSSSSAVPNRLSDSPIPSGSITTSPRPLSFLSSLPSAYSSCSSRTMSRSNQVERQRPGDDSHEHEDEPAYPEILKSIASSKGVKLPKLPKTLAARRTILREKGSISKGKTPYNLTLDLSDPGYWKVSHVYEDTSYTTPHYLAEIILTPPRPGSRSALYSGDRYYVTAAEIRAIIRLMRLRKKGKRYRHHGIHPLLVISYMEEQPSFSSDGIDEYGMVDGRRGYRSARIIQAHHDGVNLVIQYSQRLLFSEKLVERSVERLLGYYFAETVMAGPLVERGGEWDAGSLRMLRSWGSWKMWWGVYDARDGDDDLDEGEDWWLRHWFTKRLSFGNN